MVTPKPSATSTADLIVFAREALESLRSVTVEADRHKEKGLSSDEARLVQLLEQSGDRGLSPIRRSIGAKLATAIKTDFLGLAEPVAPRIELSNRREVERELEEIRANRDDEFDLDVVDQPRLDPTAITRQESGTREEHIASLVWTSAAIQNREQFATNLKSARAFVGVAAAALCEIASRTDQALVIDPSWRRAAPDEAMEREDYKKEFINASGVDELTEWTLEDVLFVRDEAENFFAQELPRLGYDRFGNETNMSILATQDQQPGIARLHAAFDREESIGAVLVLPTTDNCVRQLGAGLGFAVVEAIDAKSQTVDIRKGISYGSQGLLLDEEATLTFAQLENGSAGYSLDASTSALNQQKLTVDTSEITREALRNGHMPEATYQTFSGRTLRNAMAKVRVEQPATAIAPRQAFVEVGQRAITEIAKGLEGASR